MLEVEDIKVCDSFQANAVIIEVKSGGVFIRMIVAPHKANQVIRDIQDAIIKLGHTTWMGND